MDAMEDEIAASVARGYAFDDEDGSVIVGAGAIVQSIIAKYDVSADEETEAEGEAGGRRRRRRREEEEEEDLFRKSSPAGRGNHPAPLFSEDAAGPAVAPSRHPVDVEAARSRSRRASLEERREREGANAAAAEAADGRAPARWRHERAALVAELQEARQAAEAMRVLAASSPPRDEPGEEDSDSASLDAEEALAIARLDLESRRRCAELEAALADARDARRRGPARTRDGAGRRAQGEARRDPRRRRHAAAPRRADRARRARVSRPRRRKHGRNNPGGLRLGGFAAVAAALLLRRRRRARRRRLRLAAREGRGGGRRGGGGGGGEPSAGGRAGASRGGGGGGEAREGRRGDDDAPKRTRRRRVVVTTRGGEGERGAKRGKTDARGAVRSVASFPSGEGV